MNVAQPQPAQPQANPQAEDAAKRFHLAAQKIIYTQGVAQHLLQMIQSAQDLPTGIAQAAMFVLDKMKSQVKGMPPYVVYSSGPLVIAELVQLLGELQRVQPQDMQSMTMKALAVLSKMVRGQGQQQPQTPQPQATPAAPMTGG